MLTVQNYIAYSHENVDMNSTKWLKIWPKKPIGWMLKQCIVEN